MNWGVLNESTTAHEVDVLTSVGIAEDARRDDVAKGAEQLFQLGLEQIIFMILVIIKILKWSPEKIYETKKQLQNGVKLF